MTISLTRHSVSAQNLPKMLLEGRFRVLQPESADGPDLLVRWTIPKVFDKNKIPKALEKDLTTRILLRVDQSSVGYKNPRIIFNLFWSECANSACRAENERANEEALPLKNWEFLPRGVQISSVLYGDAERDGFTDVLLRLSNGAGVLVSLDPLRPPVWK